MDDIEWPRLDDDYSLSRMAASSLGHLPVRVSLSAAEGCLGSYDWLLVNALRILAGEPMTKSVVIGMLAQKGDPFLNGRARTRYLVNDPVCVVQAHEAMGILLQECRINHHNFWFLAVAFDRENIHGPNIDALMNESPSGVIFGDKGGYRYQIARRV